MGEDGTTVETINLSELANGNESLDNYSDLEENSNLDIYLDGSNLDIELNEMPESNIVVDSMTVELYDNPNAIALEKGESDVADKEELKESLIAQFGEDFIEKAVEEVEKFGEGESYVLDILHQWNKNMSEHADDLPANETLKDLYGDVGKLVSEFDKWKGVYGAVQAIIADKSTDSPSQSLKTFKSIFDAARGVVNYVPGIYEILAGYSQFISAMTDYATKLEKKLKEENLSLATLEGMNDLLYPEVFPGGLPLFHYMNRLMVSEKELEIMEAIKSYYDNLKNNYTGEYDWKQQKKGIIEWVKSNYYALTLATGEAPPFEEKIKAKISFHASFIPIKITKVPTVTKLSDENELVSWFFNNKEQIKNYVYGGLNP
jgi:hypothetical protein